VSFLRTSLVSLLFSSSSFLGCGFAEPIETGEIEASPAQLQVTREPHSATYYIGRVDTRRCAFPMCGGFFLSAVNQRQTRCPRGTLSDECYVSNLDFSRFDGSTESEAVIRDAMGFDLKTTRVVLRGTLQPAILGAGSLRVDMAWIATDTQEVWGTFYKTWVNGVVCVAAPCPSYDQEILNTGRDVSFHGFDFDAVPAHSSDGTYTVPALNSKYGLIVAGENEVVDNAGPAGQGIFLKASQVFIPVLVKTRRIHPLPQPAPSLPDQ
jgi:hypothetical protein